MGNSEKKEWQKPTVTDLDISKTKGSGTPSTFEGYVYNSDTGEKIEEFKGPS